LTLAAQTDDLQLQCLATDLVLTITSSFVWSVDDFLESGSIRLFMNFLSHPDREIRYAGFLILAHFHRTLKGCRLSIEEHAFSKLCIIFNCLNEEVFEEIEILQAISKAFRFISVFVDVLPDGITNKLIQLYSEALKARPGYFLSDALIVMDNLVRKRPNKCINEIADSEILHIFLCLMQKKSKTSKDLFGILRFFCLILQVRDDNVRKKIVSHFNCCLFLNLLVESKDSEICRMATKVLQNISCLQMEFDWIFDKAVCNTLIGVMENGSYSDKVCVYELIFSAMAWGSIGVIRRIFETKLPFLALDGVGCDQSYQATVNCMFAMDRAIGMVLRMGMEDYCVFDQFCEECARVLLRMMDCVGTDMARIVYAVLERRFPEVCYVEAN
jgi:hypothetical protein